MDSLLQTTRGIASRTFIIAGSSKPTRTPMIARTTKSSNRVKARRFLGMSVDMANRRHCGCGGW